MTHDELLASIEKMMNHDAIFMKDALIAVVELHYEHTSGSGDVYCYNCQQKYPCLTIQAIEKKLS